MTEEFALPEPEIKVLRKKRVSMPLRYYVQASMLQEGTIKAPRKFHLSEKLCVALDAYAQAEGVTKSQIVAFALTMFFKRYSSFKAAKNSGKDPDAARWFLESLMDDPQ